MRSRCRIPAPPAVRIKPPFDLRANSVTARSISSASRMPTGVTSTPNNDATAWIAPNWPLPEATVGSRRTATRVTLGAICLSSSSHLPLMPYSRFANPVALPPGRARLATKPLPTGSATAANTIGTVRVACCTGAMTEPPFARMTSGASDSGSSAASALSTPMRRIRSPCCARASSGQATAALPSTPRNSRRRSIQP